MMHLDPLYGVRSSRPPGRLGQGIFAEFPTIFLLKTLFILFVGFRSQIAHSDIINRDLVTS